MYMHNDHLITTSVCESLFNTSCRYTLWYMGGFAETPLAVSSKLPAIAEAKPMLCTNEFLLTSLIFLFCFEVH